ncbi:phage holin family protein [Streptomyces sp. S.PNR 29]|uniref:phage holin family protein n=1 Tax=Streptomyces sp. S.PNR 29 TaxID=2973805 RepID=UPI0025B15883|nr:phage holin family protein [Streptomyces sp. S.PNR 29]MDN0193710.1 phage holin family protein [Streptomyces sp. S.PNR 29]
MEKRRRVLGTFLGVTLATVLLPGISPILDSPPWEVVLAGAVFLIVNQLIYSYPSNIRTAPPVLLLILGVVGVIQDTLIWLLVSWLGSDMEYGLHVDGFLAALLGGVIVRATVLVLLALGPQEPAPQSP